MTPSPQARSSAEKVNGKPPARAAFCIQNAAVAAFRMRRRRGAVRSAASAAPRAISAERKASVEAFTTPLSFPHGKESAVDGRKKGWQRGICVGTNSTSLILSAACGGQASSVPLFLLFPHESLRWIRVGTLSPFANPLKTTKKGAAAPFLGFSPELGLCSDRLRLAKRATDADLSDRRSHRNSLRMFQL